MPGASSSKEGLPRLGYLRILASGLCMGAADIVPGISGGTVAFILGIYPGLLASLNSFDSQAFTFLATGQGRLFLKAVNWKFLLTLVAGVALAFFLLAPFLHDVLGHETHRIYLYAAFLGLILASSIFCAKQVARWGVRTFIALLAGAIIAYSCTEMPLQIKAAERLFDVELDLGAIEPQPVNYQDSRLLDIPETTLAAMLAKKIIAPDTLVVEKNTEQQGFAAEMVGATYSLAPDLWVVCCGAIAVSAMLLPGISGSYLLTILGMYGVVIAALADFVQGIKSGVFEVEAFSLLGSMALGIVLGAVLFSRVVSWLLRHYRDGTIALLTGFMLGAIGSVWPFWSYVYTLLPLKLEKGLQLQAAYPVVPDFFSSLFLIATAYAVVGFASVFLLEGLATYGHRPKSSSP